jgi:predicted MFS family arabinose efflux permease
VARFRFSGLWRNPEFLKLWGGQSISILGSSVTALALPTTAILVLDANPFQVGLLNALARLPFPILALLAGAWVDRVRRRPLMIAADIGRMVTLGSIPVAAVLGVLTLNHLYAVALLGGVCTVFFDVAYLAYFPGLVGRESVVEGNTKLQFSESVTSLAGPALAGLLIRLAGPARAIAVDAVSFLVSALALLRIRTPEQKLLPSGRSGLQDIGDGLRFVFGNPLLRSLVVLVGAAILGGHAVESVRLPFAYQQLQLDPSGLGLALSAGGIGALAGVLVTARVIRAIGVGPTIGISGFVQGVAFAGIALAAWLPAVPTLATVQFTAGFFDPMHNVTQQSLRQGSTPDALQGRMNATFRTIYWGAWPLGNLLGGLLGVQIGLVETIVLGGAWTALASLLVFATPLRHVRAHPSPDP